MKFRSPGEVRVLDTDGYKRRAACICVRDVNSASSITISTSSTFSTPPTFAQQRQQTEILLISSSKKPDVWLVPGGGVDPNEDVATAAARESFEEAGVKGRLEGFLGVFETSKGTLTRTHVFQLVVEEEVETWAEASTRKRKWFPLEEASEMLQTHKPAQKVYLDKLVRSMRTKFDNRSNLDNRLSLWKGNSVLGDIVVVGERDKSRDKSKGSQNVEAIREKLVGAWKSRSAVELRSAVGICGEKD